MSEKIYAERDIIGMDSNGGHYCRHISAMTREDLHSKSDIAAELGFRDMVIAELEAKCAALAAKGMEVAAEAAVVYGKYNETQMPDRDLVDMQTLQEMHDLCAGVKNADAFLAEVRASAVDEVCLKISNAIVNCYQDEQIGLDAAATICGDFAAQLRQEAQ